MWDYVYTKIKNKQPLIQPSRLAAHQSSDGSNGNDSSVKEIMGIPMIRAFVHWQCNTISYYCIWGWLRWSVTDQQSHGE